MNILHQVVVFGGGCFWCTEAVFKMFKGVISVEPGYAGGVKEKATYRDVSGGNTGHAEVIKIDFDPSKISYRDLLTVFFGSHDPTTPNRQGADVGTQYRSVIFYTTIEQREQAEKFITELNKSNAMGESIVTEVAPLEAFYPAEQYHKDYYAKNLEQVYCQLVINPKLEKVQEKFAELLKNNYKI